MCYCIEKLNAALKPHNLEITQTIKVGSTLHLSPALIQTNKINKHKRGGNPPMEAKYCPFCGQSYAVSAALDTATAPSENSDGAA